jgi:translocation and assembly module TamB
MTEAQPAVPVTSRRAAPAFVIIFAVGVVALLAILFATIRYGAVTQPGRLLIEAQVSGLKIGRLGRLKVQGLRGDIWRDFMVSRLIIYDEKGVWLDARDVTVRWRYTELFRRRFSADAIAARQLTLVRRPTLTPKGKSRDLPVAFHIASLRTRVEMQPAFSYRRGVYDVRANLDVARDGGVAGKVRADSALHAGDYLTATFAAPKKQPFLIQADALEAQGGALAGALGLAPDKPFRLVLRAAGTESQGSFSLATRVGETAPAEASGAWTKAGGSADGRITLAASRLLAGWQKRLGPEARFHVEGRKAASGFYDLALTWVSDNLTLAARGEADVGRRLTGPRGMAIDVAFKDATPFLGTWPPVAGARLKGGLGSDGKRWVIAGRAVADDLDIDGYTLRQLAGPVRITHDRGETTVVTTADGEGGGGRGLLPGLLGGRPHGSAELVWLKDGRLLMRRLAAQGPGIKATGVGERTLFGALTFKGQATVTNLAVANRNARGVVAGAWSATQTHGDKPWAVTLDVRGQAFAAGLGELDRLLGQTPRLRARMDYKDGVFAVLDSTIDGYAGALASTGIIGPGPALKLKLDWRAAGPFRFGPLEIAGDARGTGALTGTINNPRADLMADFDRIDLPNLPLQKAHMTLSFLQGANDTNGAIAVTATSRYGPTRGEAAFRFLPGGVDLSNIAVSAGGAVATGSLALRGREPSSADLVLAVGPGEFLSQGHANGRLKIVDAAGGARAALSLEASNAALKSGGVAVKSLKLTADGPLARLPYQVQAEGLMTGGPWRLSGSGVASEAGGDYAFTFDGSGRLRRAEFRTLAPADIRLTSSGTTARLQLAVGGGRADVDYRVASGAAAIKASMADVSLGLLDEDFIGRFDANLALQGSGSNLAGQLEATLAGAGGRDLKGASPVDGVVKARLAGDQLAVDASLHNTQGLKADANLILPAEASAAPFRIAINRKRPMQGRFAIDGELKPLWDLAFGGERSLAGHLTATGTLKGTLADPRAVGTASLADGRFYDAATGLKLEKVQLQAVLADNAVDVNQFTGGDGANGTVMGAGRISLRREGASTFRLDLKDFRLIDNDIAEAQASGVATINRAADGKVQLTGALTLSRAEIAPNPPVPTGVVPMDVVEVNRPLEMDERFQATGMPQAPPIALDVTLKAARNVFVKGRGLNVEFSLDSHVGGTTQRPLLTGVARVVRGDYDFAGRRFQFDNRGAVYLGATAQTIRLDLTATRDDPSLTAVIRIQGTAAKPRITLTSSPVLPNDEVLSKVLFGASVSQLSPLEAAQLASALSALAGGGGFDVMGNLRSFARLDRLAIGGDAVSGVTVSGGKYLSDDVYLELTGGGREGPSMQVEWRVRRSLSIVSRLTRQGDTRLSVRWRRDY